MTLDTDEKKGLTYVNPLINPIGACGDH